MKNLADAILFTALYEWHLIVCRQQPERKLPMHEFCAWAAKRRFDTPFF